LSCHRHRVLFAFLYPALLAATTFGDQIPSTTKSSTGPATYQSQIQLVINNAAKDLASEDPAAPKHGRESLIYECENHAGGGGASQQFQSLYATLLAKTLLPLTKPNVSLRTRLNVAIVTREIAAKSYKNVSSDPLAPLVSAELSDKQEPVVLWGLKAARYVIPAVATNAGNAAALSKLVVQAAKAHGDSGPVIEEAYGALILEPTLAGSILPDLLDLLEWRTKQYQGGANTPPSTLAEQSVTVFLSVNAFPAVNANPVILNRTLKDVADFSCAVLQSFAAGNNSGDLIEMIRATGSAINAFGQQLANNDLKAAGDAIAKVGPNTPAGQVTASCAALAAALKPMNININPVGAAAAVDPAIAGK
jgi:hypothetical protein